MIISKITQMQRKKYFQKKIIKNINQYKRTKDCMEFEETSSDESLYDPVEEGDGINSLINDDFLVKLVDLVGADSSIRNISAFLFSLLTGAGVSFKDISDIFEKIGLQKAATSRLNLISIHTAEFDLKSGGEISKHNSLKRFY